MWVCTYSSSWGRGCLWALRPWGQHRRCPPTHLVATSSCTRRYRYILGALLCPLYDEEPGSAELAIVVEACQQLEATYSWAVCQLTGGDSCSDGSQEQQQSCEELLAAQGPAGDGLPGCSQLESRDAGGGLREARRLGRGTELPPDVGEVAQASELWALSQQCACCAPHSLGYARCRPPNPLPLSAALPA